MKKVTTTILAVLLLNIGLMQSGCFGEFALISSVYEWNDDVADSKFVKTLVFYGLNIIPVYGIAAVGDVFILNLIEFWSGSNPMSMNQGEEEMQFVKYRGNDFQITATLNRLSVEQLTGKKQGAAASLVFNPETDIWTIESNDKKIRVAKMLRNKYNKNIAVNFYKQNGEIITIPYSENGMAIIREMIAENSDLAVK